MAKQKLKQTEIGMIPDGWEIKPIGDILTLEYGKGLSGTNRKIGPYPVYGSNGIVGSHSDFLIKAPGIVVGRKGSIGEVVWAEKNFWPIDTSYFITLKSDKTSLRWIYYKLQNMKLSKLNTATGIPGLNRELVYVQEIPVPGEKEQNEIANVLLTIDKRLDIVERERRSIDRIKVGFMKELLDGKKWKLARVDEVFEVETGTTPSTKVKEYWDNGTVDWITPADMNNLDNDLDLPESNRKITQKALKEVHLTLMPIGSIIMSTRAPVGYIGLVKKELTFNQGCKGLIPKDKTKINVIFFAYYLLSLKEYLNNVSGGSTFKELSKDSLCKLEVPIPPISEQNRIAEILGTLDKKLLIQNSKKSKLEKIKKSLMDDLLTGKKRVKVL